MTPARYRTYASEAQIHIQIMCWLRLSLRSDAFAIHIPNGSALKGGELAGARFKMMGVTAGVPDILILGPCGSCHALEVKAAKGRESPAQREFAEVLARCRVPRAVVRSVEEAEVSVRGWGLVRGGAA